MATRKPTENDQTSLPFGALQLLAPPVRLVSAALWKVMKERDVMQYGIVEEFVTSACDNVPGLLTLRHRAKLTLALRARLILELCRKQPDPKKIAEHMKRISESSLSSSTLTVRRDARIHSAVESFHALVPMLLTDRAERKRFFTEDFPVAYGQQFDHEVEKLLWEFLIRLDQLLPVPNLAQTVSWLSDAPPVLEECARAATQPQLLKILLQHQSCLGHLETAAALPPNMGDSILASLSLPPSGKVPDQSTASVSVYPQSAQRTPFIKPVIGLITNDNVPCMISASKHLRNGETTRTSDENSESLVSESDKNIKSTEITEKQGGRSGIQDISVGRKRKHIGYSENTSDEEEDVLRTVRTVKRKTRNFEQTRDDCERNDMVDNRVLLRTCLNDLGFETLRVPDNRALCSILASCLKCQPKVVIRKLSLSPASDHNTSLPKPSSGSPAKANKNNSSSTHPHRTTTSVLISDNKENTPILPGSQKSSLRLNEHQGTSGQNEDYVADSEDEAIKNFKGRLFAKRYYKTKHGTFVPTLREYWKPRAGRRGLVGPGNKHR